MFSRGRRSQSALLGPVIYRLRLALEMLSMCVGRVFRHHRGISISQSNRRNLRFSTSALPLHLALLPGLHISVCHGTFLRAPDQSILIHNTSDCMHRSLRHSNVKERATTCTREKDRAGERKGGRMSGKKEDGETERQYR